jgi:hypothetical protein
MQLASREKEEPEGIDLPGPLPLYLLRRHHLCEPPTGVRHPVETLARPHTAETTQRHLSCTLDIAIADDGRRAWLGHHRPSTVPSPRHQSRIEPMDQFP